MFKYRWQMLQCLLLMSQSSHTSYLPFPRRRYLLPLIMVKTACLATFLNTGCGEEVSHQQVRSCCWEELQLPIYCSLYVNTSLQWWFWMFLEWKIPAVKFSKLQPSLMSGPGVCRIMELCQTKRIKSLLLLLVFDTKKIQHILKGRQLACHICCLPNGRGLQTIPRDTRVSGCLCHCATIALETPCHVLCTF